MSYFNDKNASIDVCVDTKLSTTPRLSEYDEELSLHPACDVSIKLNTNINEYTIVCNAEYGKKGICSNLWLGPFRKTIRFQCNNNNKCLLFVHDVPCMEHSSLELSPCPKKMCKGGGKWVWYCRTCKNSEYTDESSID